MVSQGFLAPLAVAGTSTDLETQREVAAALCNLSLSDQNKVAIAKSSVLKALITLAQSKDVEVARQGVGAIGNIAEDVSTHEYIDGTFMIGLMHHDSLDVYREASRAISNLLTSEMNHARVIKDGILGIIHLALSTDPECLYNASLCFRKLSCNISSHEQIIMKGGLTSLFYLTEHSDMKIKRQAAYTLRDLSSNKKFKLKYADEGGIANAATLHEIHP